MTGMLSAHVLHARRSASFTPAPLCNRGHAPHARLAGNYQMSKCKINKPARAWAAACYSTWW